MIEFGSHELKGLPAYLLATLLRQLMFPPRSTKIARADKSQLMKRGAGSDLRQ